MQHEWIIESSNPSLMFCLVKYAKKNIFNFDPCALAIPDFNKKTKVDV